MIDKISSQSDSETSHRFDVTYILNLGQGFLHRFSSVSLNDYHNAPPPHNSEWLSRTNFEAISHRPPTRLSLPFATPPPALAQTARTLKIQGSLHTMPNVTLLESKETK